MQKFSGGWGVCPRGHALRASGPPPFYFPGSAPAEALFTAIEKEFGSRKIPWSNIGYASDTASVMVGRCNSVLSRLLQKQPKLLSLGCLCHLSALCAAAALKSFLSLLMTFRLTYFQSSLLQR